MVANRPRIGDVKWQVEWIADADVPQAFKDDEDRDLHDVYKWERRRAFTTEAQAMKFAEGLTGLFFGVCDVVKVTFERDRDVPELPPEWQRGRIVEVEPAN